MAARGGDVMPSLRAPLAAGGVSPGRAARLRQGPARPQRSPQAAGDARAAGAGPARPGWWRDGDCMKRASSERRNLPNAV